MNANFTKKCFSLLLTGVSFITMLCTVGLLQSNKSWAEESEADISINTFDTSVDKSASSLVSGCNKGSTNTVPVGGSIKKGHWWGSTNRIYRLDFQNDGNLVLYHYTYPCNRHAIWSSKTDDQRATYMFYDNEVDCLGIDGSCWSAGNLVITNREGYPRWNAFSDPRIHVNPGVYTPFYLIVQNDGNVVMYGRYGSPAWATGTNGQ